jgi:prepilin-type N-terminal cleavage/methylation domain-containing protein
MIHPNLIRHRGFTLIELMIVVAVIGLLAVVAYPSFQQSIIKSDRSDARTALAEILLAQERFKQASAWSYESAGWRYLRRVNRVLVSAQTARFYQLPLIFNPNFSFT